MRLVVAGTPEVALPSLAALAASSHEIAAVVTRPDAAAGRGRKAQRSPVGLWADEAGIPVLQPARPSEPEFLAALADLAPDCCPVIAYGALVPQVALDVPKHGWVNLHFSLLPAWRGAAPVQHALIAGDAMTGASTFRLETGLDTGPVFGVMTEVVRPRDTAGDLLGRLAEGGAHLLVATLDGIESGEIEARPQPDEGVSLAPKITVADAEVDWSQSSDAIDRRVRGCTPNPGAWTTLRGERLGLGPVLPVRKDEGADDVRPGQLLVTKRSVRVGTAYGLVELGEVKPAGKRLMAAADWARGVRIEAGETFS
ncbi:methionyl-tRNA formyltransferase [Spongisporangium articulatum]|uniref:Methionyl-tRNA formyltransferase n=1 Tax=Spongisporangium articulatum TaxID=3362603 RepID=A0ABW8ARB3_9ACTN